MSAAALVIAAENLMPALRERVKVEGDVITFPVTEPIQALQAILEQRPDLVFHALFPRPGHYRI